MSGEPLVARCPAKVNLVLRVGGRRPDGYHELETIFQAIDLWDTLRIEPAAGLGLSCDDRRLPTDENNLVLRAAALLSRRFSGRRLGAALSLNKTIPMQAGLGGGSSDAAAALILCNRFWCLGLGLEELDGFARELGADVPFFLRGGSAHGRGRGDRIEPLPFLGRTPILLGLPPFGISTAEVFSRVAARLTLPCNFVSVSLFSGHKWPEEKDFGFLANDLEEVVFEGWPELRQFRDALLETGAAAALLSGSGSAVFGVFPHGPRPAEEIDRLRERFPRWRVLATCSIEDGIRLGATGEHEFGPNREA